MTYRTYFRTIYRFTPHWAKVRRLVKERAQGLCELCGEEGREVHHLYYDYFWFEDSHLESVILVCPGCHRMADDYRKKFGRRIVPEEVYIATL